MDEKKTQQRQFLVILTIVFVGFLGISIPYLIFPALFLNPEYSILASDWNDSSRAIFLGITLAAYPLGQFIGSPILGSLSDDYGRKKLLAGSLLIAALCYLFSGVAIASQQLSLLIVSRFIAGLMEGNIAIARAMASELTALSKHKTFGRINASSSIAYLIGPFFGGLLTDKNIYKGLSISTPFYLTCLLFLALSFFSSALLKSDAKGLKNYTITLWQRLNLFNRLLVLFANKRLQFLMIVSTCFTLAVDVFYEFGPVFLIIKWNLAPSQMIVYNGVLCLTLAIGYGWLPTHVTTIFNNRSIILFSITTFSILLVFMLLIHSTYMMMALFALSGFVIGLTGTLLTVKISNSAPDSIQGEVMGVQLSLRVFGDALICLFGGALLILSPKLILAIAAALALFVAIYYRLKTKDKSWHKAESKTI